MGGSKIDKGSSNLLIIVKMATLKQIVKKAIWVCSRRLQRKAFIDLYSGEGSFWARQYLIRGSEPLLTPQQYEETLALHRGYLEVYEDFFLGHKETAKYHLRRDAESLYLNRLKREAQMLCPDKFIDGKLIE